MSEKTSVTSPRLASLDAYRGFVMFLMMAEVLQLVAVSKAVPDSSLWKWLAWHQSHVAWVGCTLHDLIQPSFSFLVGVALPFSLASRRSQGQSPVGRFAHAVWRSLLLILLGVFLRSDGRNQIYWTFEDTLSQIGLGYLFLFGLGQRSPRVQGMAVLILLVGYWWAFVSYPLPGKDFDYASVGVPANWQEHATGLAAHFNKNSNLAWAFEKWFLNKFPRETPFAFHPGGYATLSFVPTLATMILGLIAGGWLRSDVTVKAKLGQLLLAGLLLIGLGLAIHFAGVCPIVKRIWTPSWTLFSGGCCCLLLALFYGVIDGLRWRWWSYPLVVIGANSIFAYCGEHLFQQFIRKMLRTVFGADAFKVWGEAYEPLLGGAAVLCVLWLMLLWMYRRKLFLRV